MSIICSNPKNHSCCLPRNWKGPLFILIGSLVPLIKLLLGSSPNFWPSFCRPRAKLSKSWKVPRCFSWLWARNGAGMRNSIMEWYKKYVMWKNFNFNRVFNLREPRLKFRIKHSWLTVVVKYISNATNPIFTSLSVIEANSSTVVEAVLKWWVGECPLDQ